MLYDVTYFTVYNDGVPPVSRYVKGEPLGIEIRQTVFASSSIPKLDNTVMIRYSILNTGIVADTLKDVIFSIYANPEIGYSSRYDDMIGCDTTLQSGFAYNNGDDDRLGVNPPSIFQTLLQEKDYQRALVLKLKKKKQLSSL